MLYTCCHSTSCEDSWTTIDVLMPTLHCCTSAIQHINVLSA